jgi:SAM-dependent methyltransferase
MESAVKHNMRCIVCDATDKWKSVDQYRIVPKGMAICQGCGLVSYPALYKTEEEIKAYYRTDYRAIPKVGNLYTGMKKLHNHDAFIGPELERLKARKEAPVIGEIGAAYGLFLNHLKRNYFPKGEFYGTELTTTYRRVAYYEHDLMLTEDFDTTKKYDLITSYKVAEHQMDADKRLREYALALAEDGMLYISVPTWFDAMVNFGLPGFDLEYYYDTNHINAWSRKLFETVLKKAGLEVVKYDGVIYGSTYLCKRNDELMKLEPEYEDPAVIEATMAHIKEAYVAFQRQDFAGAVKAYPNYPDAWMANYEHRRHELHSHKQEVKFEDLVKEFYEPFKAACGECYLTWRFMADLAMRYDQFELSLEYWQKCILASPGAGNVLAPITHCYRRMADMTKDPKLAAALRQKSVEITRHWLSADLESRPEAVNWLYFDLSKLKLPSEMRA